MPRVTVFLAGLAYSGDAEVDEGLLIGGLTFVCLPELGELEEPLPYHQLVLVIDVCESRTIRVVVVADFQPLFCYPPHGWFYDCNTHVSLWLLLRTPVARSPRWLS